MNNIGSYITAGIIGFAVGQAGANTVGIPARAPKEVLMQVGDLNNDGTNDLVIMQQRGHKVPMYGVREDTGVRYLSAKEMRKLNPNSKVDYESIESRLNE